MIERKKFLVRTVTASDCLCDLPRMQPYSAGCTPIDLLVVSAGFEERVLEIPRLLQRDRATILGEILVGHYQTNLSDNQTRFEELSPLLTAFGATISGFDADDPLGAISAISDAIDRCATPSIHVGFDVSGASSTLILSVIAALARSRRSITVTVFYTSAKSYDKPMTNQVEPLVLGDRRETGIGTEPMSAPFGGHHHDHLPISVIALPSLYTDRLEACLAHLSVGPITGSEDNLFWLLPATGIEEHKWRQDHTLKAVIELVLRLQGREGEPPKQDVIKADNMATSDVLDYADTIRCLVDRIDHLPGRNISIVHMGSKLQAIGVALTAAARSEVAVLTVRPASFNASKYSQGIGRSYTLRFPDLTRIVRSIEEIGMLRVTNP